MNKKVAKDFLEIVKKYDKTSKNLFGHNYYEVLGQKPFSKFSQENYEKRNKYIKNEITDRELSDSARSCLNFVKTIICNPEKKKAYDEKLKLSLIEDLKSIIRSATADKILHHAEKKHIINVGKDNGLTIVEIDKIIQQQKSLLRFKEELPNKENARLEFKTYRPRIRLFGGIVAACIILTVLIVLISKSNSKKIKSISENNQTGVEVKQSFWRNSENILNVRSVINYLNRGKYDKVYDLVTKDSELEVLIFGRRFYYKNPLLFKRNHFPQIEEISYKEYYVNSSYSYVILDFKIEKAKNFNSESAMDRFTSSLSPWTQKVEKDIFRDSIPIIDGLIEFCLGKSFLPPQLKETSTAACRVDWLNVRQKPTKSSKVLGKIKSPYTGEMNVNGKVNELELHDFYYTILVDKQYENKDWSLCYFFSHHTGEYEKGYVYSKHLTISEYSYQ